MPLLDQSLVLNQTGHLAYHEGEAERLLDLVVDVKRDFDAVGDGATDDTAAIQAAADMLKGAGGGVLFFPVGTFVVSSRLKLEGSVWVRGIGEGSIVKVKSGAISAPFTDDKMFIFDLTGATSTFVFSDIAIDANGPGQDWTGAVIATDFYQIICAKGNCDPARTCDGAADAKLIISDVTIRNASMSAAVPLGIAVNTFGAATQYIKGLTIESCDMGVFVTQPFPADPNFTHISGLHGRGVNRALLFLEGFGGVTASNITAIDCDGDGIAMITTNPIAGCSINGGYFQNCRFPVNVGFGGTEEFRNSTIAGLVAVDCLGSFQLNQVDSSCAISRLVARGCAIGGIPATFVFGSIEVGGGSSSDHVHIVECVVEDSQNAGVAFNGPGSMLGGQIGTVVGNKINFSPGAPGSAAAVKAASRIRDVRGFNPQGIDAPVIAGASPYTYTNEQGVPMAVYVTGGTVSKLTKDGEDFFAGTDVTVFLEPGEAFTITHTGAPSLLPDRK